MQLLGAQALQTDRPASQGREQPDSFHMVGANRDALAQDWGSAGPTLRSLPCGSVGKVVVLGQVWLPRLSG